MTSYSSIRLGLCCSFASQPIKFRNTTVKAIRGMDRDAARAKLARLCLANADALQASLRKAGKSLLSPIPHDARENLAGCDASKVGFCAAVGKLGVAAPRRVQDGGMVIRTSGGREWIG